MGLEPTLSQLSTREGVTVRQKLILHVTRVLRWREVRPEQVAKADVLWFSGVADVQPQFVPRGPGDALLSRWPGVTDLLGKVAWSQMQDGVPSYPQSWVFEQQQTTTTTDDGDGNANANYDNVMATVDESVAWFVVKPDTGRGGAGIELVHRSNLGVRLRELTQHGHVVAQQHIDSPCLLDGRKFDVRLYILLGDVSPTSVAFVYHEGLVRLCSATYTGLNESTHDDRTMHLTNFEVNKASADYVAAGGKRKFTDVLDVIALQMPQGTTTEALWMKTKAALAAQVSRLAAALRERLGDGSSTYEPTRCFHLLGADVMFSRDGGVWVVEMNTNPALGTGAPVDWAVKEALMKDTLTWVKRAKWDTQGRSAHLMSPVGAYEVLLPMPLQE